MSPPSIDFNVLVGAETGILKGVNVNPKANIAKNFHAGTSTISAGGKLSREDEITCLSWNGTSRSEALLALRNRTVRVFDVAEKRFVETIDLSKHEDKPGEDLIRGIGRLDDTLITASKSGTVKLWRYGRERSKQVEFNTIHFELGQSGKLKKDSFANSEERQKHFDTLAEGRELCRMRQSPVEQSVVATGGKENDLQLWDLQRTDAGPKFRARNVKNNFLDIRVPVWISDICFPDLNNPSQVCAVSRHSHVRLYDAREGEKQRRPVRELEFPEESLTAVSATSDGSQVLVGSARGRLALFDFRNGRGEKGLVRKYKGFVGGVRSLDAMRNGPHFAAVGLDRFLRVYDVNGKSPVQRMYLKSRLNCVLLAANFDPNKTDSERLKEQEEEEEEPEIIAEIGDDVENEGGEAEEDDALWENMGVVGQKEEIVAGSEDGDVVATKRASRKRKLK